MSRDEAPEYRLSDAEFREFRDFFRNYCGLDFDESSRFRLEEQIARRVEELGLGSFAAYRYMLRTDSAGEGELARVVDELTTNETYFFRERGQLRSLVEEVVPEVLMQRAEPGTPPVSIWSAGCSSGAEPYSVVALALEAGLRPGRDFRVYASDISHRMLEKARRGVYRPASLRECEGYLQHKYFQEKDGHYWISDDVKRHVVFTHLNLAEPARMALLGPMDVILCRNVIMYFDAETRKRVVESFYEKLRPGGTLMLGHAESLINLSTSFELRRLRDDLVYRRSGNEGPRDRFQSAALAALREESEGES